MIFKGIDRENELHNKGKHTDRALATDGVFAVVEYDTFHLASFSESLSAVEVEAMTRDMADRIK